MVDDSPIRLAASEVGLNPLVGGHDNVQDFAQNFTGVTFHPTSAKVFADAATSIASDGAGHALPFVVAAPPAWLDATGHILIAGLYLLMVKVQNTAAVATAGQYLQIQSPQNLEWLDAADALRAVGPVVHGEVVSLTAADLPYAVSPFIQMPTDATATYDCTAGAVQLAT